MKSYKFIALGFAAASLLAPLSASAQVFDGRNLLGTAIGAGIGGAVGSNLAGGGVQDEGTAIGAAVGGLLGYGIANSTRPRNFGPNYGPYYGGGHNGYSNYGGSSRYGSAPYGNYGNYGGASRYGSGHSYGYQYGYQHGYQGTYVTQPVMPAPQYVYGGSVVTQVYTVPTYHTYTYTPPPTISYAPPVYTNCGC